MKVRTAVSEVTLSFAATNQSLKSAFQRRGSILLLRALEKLLNFCVLLVGFVHLVVELRSARAVWVGDQEALCFLHFSCLLRFYFADRARDVLSASQRDTLLRSCKGHLKINKGAKRN